VEQQEKERDLSYEAELEHGLGLCSQIIDTLVDMIYLAAEDEAFLTPDVRKWLDGLQALALSTAEIVNAADAEG
jgi:hypothetical protein